MLNFINILIGGEQKHQSIKTDGICTCLCSSMGSGGGYVPMIVMTENREQRTENSTGSEFSCQGKIVKKQVGVDLCYIETKLVDISACICVRYDAGICRHKMEHTGVLVEYE